MIDFFIQYGYWGFFVASFLSATVLPFPSEVVLFALLHIGASPVLCVLFGTVGNVLGGLTCYWIGSKGKIEWMEKYLGVSKEKVESVQTWVANKGAPMAFFSFLPIIGDVINIALGFLHSKLKWVVVFMTLGKFARYLFILYIKPLVL